MDDEATKIVLITGASRGLGLATARHVGTSGATVLIGARDETRGGLAASELRSDGIDAHLLDLDVDSPDSVQAAAKAVEQRWGRLDVLINNAGILPEATTADADRPIDLELFEGTFRTNLFGAVTVIHAFLPLLAQSSGARIVNVSSTVGSLAAQSDPASPYYGLVVPAYQASKAALNMLTVSLSKALRDVGICVNSVCPGWVQTDLGGPENRAAAPTPADEAAEIVASVALDGSGRSGQFVDRAGLVPW